MRLPIRIRLTVAFAVVLAVALGAVGGFVYVRFRADANAAVDAELRTRTAAFFAAGGSDLQLRINLLGVSDEHFGQVVRRNGRVLARSEQLGRTPFARSTPGFRNAVIHARDERRNVRLLVTQRNRVTLILASALDDRDDALGHLASLIWFGGGVTLLVGAGLAWLLAGAALRPVDRLRRAADNYSASDLAGRLVVPAADDELARLAVTLNEMLERIQGSFDRERAFVDRASHELRTPLANLSMELDLALRRERSSEELRVALTGAADEARRLDRLASNLLVLARTTDGKLPVVLRSTDLDELVRETTQTFMARAEAAGIELRTELHAPDPVVVDPVRVRQVLTNLLDNALRVTPAGAAVVVGTEVSDDNVRIAVTDSGPGFAPELRETAFEMFVRGRDAAGSTDGAGLGLAIVAAVANAHRGSVRIEGSEPDTTGATVSITLPRRGSEP